MDEDIWAGFSAFQAASFTHRFLKACYRLRGFDKAEAKSYRNSFPFLYYLQHGKRHYKLAESAPIELQPLLLFYGTTQLMKACLLTADPDYPKTTAVLAHGVSTRKKKKKDYAFSEDEVRIQKHGLAVHFSRELYNLEPLEGKKFGMRALLERVPDLNDLFKKMYGRSPFQPIFTANDGKIKMSSQILDDLHMTLPRFIDFLEKHAFPTVEEFRETHSCIELKLDSTGAVLPFPSSLSGQVYAPCNREQYDGLPEMFVHFLLLYNLSMIARYETEWWSELFHQAADDLPFIQLFLEVTRKKIPLMTLKYLQNLRKGWNRSTDPHDRRGG